MTEMVPVPICGREDWTILMPAERAARVQWPWHEWNRFHSMFHNLRPGDVLFDIGAEQGDQSALYQRWIQREAWSEEWPAARFLTPEQMEARSVREGGIVLVEPNPVAWANIKAVWEINGLREPLHCVEAFVGSDDRNTQGNIVGWPAASRYQMASYVGTAIPSADSTFVTLDYLTTCAGTPNAVTIDIEGGELDALMGAKAMLTYDRPLVWVSVHWQQLLERGQSRQALIDYMHALGYKHEHLGEDHECHSFFYPEERRPVLPYDGVVGS